MYLQTFIEGCTRHGLSEYVTSASEYETNKVAVPIYLMSGVT